MGSALAPGMTALDTNILVALWSPNAEVSTAARGALEMAESRSGIVICAPVCAELLAAPGRSEAFLRQFCSRTGIVVDWDFPEFLWRSAATNSQQYLAGLRRPNQPRRILADFLITAHAAWKCGRLLTMDRGIRALEIPRLEVILL